MMVQSEKIAANLDSDDASYKSCFARSMAVNSQHKLSKLTTQDTPVGTNNKVLLQEEQNTSSFTRVGSLDHRSIAQSTPRNKDKMGQTDDIRRISSGRRGSLCSSRIVEIPVENFVFQSQIDTLQWQLKQTEASREMYRAVMKQVVNFLEKAHRSLELLGGRINLNETTVSRSKSEHHMNITEDSTQHKSLSTTLIPDISSSTTTSEYTGGYKDYIWRRQKKQQTFPDEIPPEKLSQEAFRLLRTAQSLLNTQEPDLAQMTKDFEDSKFLEQLSKEFPSSNQHHNNNSVTNSPRTSTFSLNSKCSSKESSKTVDVERTKIQTTFNRKLSLQLTPGELRRNSISRDSATKLNNRASDSGSGSVSSECCILTTGIGDEYSLDSRMINIHKCGINNNSNNKKCDASPPISSTVSSSSADGESGFSSMNSFQEIGLPLVNSTLICNDDFINKGPSTTDISLNQYSSTLRPSMDEIKLWQRTEQINSSQQISHKRWSSTPAENLNQSQHTKQSLKVLWV